MHRIFKSLTETENPTKSTQEFRNKFKTLEGYRGVLTHAQAAESLDGAKNGDFLIRYDSMKHEFFVSVKTNKGIVDIQLENHHAVGIKGTNSLKQFKKNVIAYDLSQLQGVETLGNVVPIEVVKKIEQDHYEKAVQQGVEMIKAAPFFHGNLSSDQAKEVMKNAKAGDFLIRFSPKQQEYFLSIQTNTGILHLPLTKEQKRIFTESGGIEKLNDKVMHDLQQHSVKKLANPIESLNNEPQKDITTRPRR